MAKAVNSSVSPEPFFEAPFPGIYVVAVVGGEVSGQALSHSEDGTVALGAPVYLAAGHGFLYSGPATTLAVAYLGDVLF